MIVTISLDDAKYLSREINDTVHAGTDEAKRLNTIISNTIYNGDDVIYLNSYFGDTLIGLYYFFKDVNFFND